MVHCAENVLKSETYGKWKCNAGDKQASVVIQFEKATKIHSVDIGNEGSAFVEVLVGRSSEKNTEYQVLLVASSFMTPVESKTSTFVNRVRMFGPEKLSKIAADQKWDLVKIVCTQPFNKTVQYGLSFVKFHSTPEPGQQEKGPATVQKMSKLGAFLLKNEDASPSFTPGSLFASKHKMSPTTPLTGAAAIRQASASLSNPSVKDKLLAAPFRTSLNQTPPDKKKAEESPRIVKKLVNNSPSFLRTPMSTTPIVKRVEPQPAVNRSEIRPPPAKRLQPQATENRSQPITKRTKSEYLKPTKDIDFHKIMDGVIFVLSGFQNPGRGQLREKALEMGAKYKPDWEQTCTHLICAFANTPKYLQVKNLGGRVVRKEWILECYKKKRPLPWKMFRLGNEDSEDDEKDETEEEEEELEEEDDDDDEEEEDEEIEIERKYGIKSETNKMKQRPHSTIKTATPTKVSPSVSDKKVIPKKQEAIDDEDGNSSKELSLDESGDDTEDEIRKVKEEEKKKLSKQPSEEEEIYEGSTDEDPVLNTEDRLKPSNQEENDNLAKPNTSVFPLPELPSFFKGQHFFLFGKFDEAYRKTIKRYIIAFGGRIENYMDQKVTFVITSSEWDENFDQALKENGSLIFVRPQWIFKCNDKRNLVPHQPYAVVPKTDDS